MNNKTIAGLIMLMLVSVSFAADKEQTKTEETWTPVAGERDYYKKIKGDEVILKGTYVTEYYGKPGHRYLEAPYNYYLKMKDGKVSLIYLQNVDLNGSEVELKGKMVVGKDKAKHMYVGWYRIVSKPTKNPKAGGGEGGQKDGRTTELDPDKKLEK